MTSVYALLQFAALFPTLLVFSDIFLLTCSQSRTTAGECYKIDAPPAPSGSMFCSYLEAPRLLYACIPYSALPRAVVFFLYAAPACCRFLLRIAEA